MTAPRPIPRSRPAAHSGRRRAARRRGVTLIEIMVVIVVVAVAATGITYSLGALTQTHLRSACMTVSAAARFAYSRAVSQGTTVRLRFDFESHEMVFEEAHGSITLTRATDIRRADIEAAGGDASAADPWAAAEARLEDTFEPSFGTSPFSPLPGRRFSSRRLSSGVELVRLVVPHEPEPREDGSGAIYFFPNGQTEHAVLWVGDGSDQIFSVEIHPLTGRGRVFNYAYEPEELLDDGTGEGRSEVRDR